MLLAMLDTIVCKKILHSMEIVSYAGLAPSTRESSGKTKTGRISKQGSPWLRWILVQCAMTAVRYDQRLKSFYERLKSRKGSAKAIVATAKEILVIIWYMLTRRELYRHINKDRYEQKLSRLKKIKESAV
jgi:transposase